MRLASFTQRGGDGYRPAAHTHRARVVDKGSVSAGTLPAAASDQDMARSGFRRLSPRRPEGSAFVGLRTGLPSSSLAMDRNPLAFAQVRQLAICPG